MNIREVVLKHGLDYFLLDLLLVDAVSVLNDKVGVKEDPFLLHVAPFA